MMRRTPKTLTLLVVAFTSLLTLVGVAGVMVLMDARQVHHQTRQIMDNGLPSMISSTRLKATIPRLTRVPQRLQSDPEEGFQYFHTLVGSMRRTLEHERTQPPLFFPHEAHSLTEITQQLDRVSAEVSAMREALPAGAAFEAAEDRYLASLKELEEACERFEDLNEEGLKDAQDILFAVASREENGLLLATLATLLLGVTWAVVLAKAIARPLSDLERDLRDLPHGPPSMRPRLSALTPQEIHEVLRTFQESSRQLDLISRQREEASRELARALDREHGLNAELAQVNSGLDRQVQDKTAELAEANRQLSALIHELQLRDRSKSAFLAAISHELRTPLAIIKGAALTLDALKHLDARAHAQLLADIAEEADHLSGLVNDLLDAARMDTGSFSLEKEPNVELPLVVERVFSALATLAEDQEVALVADLDPALPLLEADPARVRQVLRNLLENAIRFSPRGGTVTLAIRRQATGTLPERIEVRVSDEGAGIPDDLVSSLFTPFTRGANAKRGGTGLGLSISKQLVEAHGGAIALVESAPGGTTFAFWLPVAAGRPNGVAEASSA